jgi:hypothetical protein
VPARAAGNVAQASSLYRAITVHGPVKSATTWEWLKAVAQSVQDTGWSLCFTPSLTGKGLGAKSNSVGPGGESVPRLLLNSADPIFGCDASK